MVQGIDNNKINNTQSTKISNDNSGNKYKAISQKVINGPSVSSDESEVNYKITIDAGKENEAQKEVEEATKNGKKLVVIIQDLIPKCKEKNTNMETIKKELANYEVGMQDYIDASMELENDTKTQLKNCSEEANAKAKEAEQTQKEIETKSKFVNDVSNNSEASESDIQKAKENQDDIDALGVKYAQIFDEMNKSNNYKNDEIIKMANDKANLMGKSMEDVKGMLESNINDAINANEYANVTIEKGLEATKLIEKPEEALKAGFLGGKAGSFHFFGFKQDISAETMGNKAIAYGEQLGNSSQEVAKKANNVRKQYGISMRSSSGLKNVLDKEYVNTSTMANLKENVSFNEKNGGMIEYFKACESKGLNMIKNEMIETENQKILNEVAEQARKKAGQK